MCDDGDPATSDDFVLECGLCQGVICDVEAGQIIPTSPVTFCSTDDISDVFTFETSGGYGEDSLLVATFLDGSFVATVDVEEINLNGGADGEYLIYLAYFNGPFFFQDTLILDDLVGCFALSEPILLTIVSGDNCPEIFDCPDLELNVGEACDDGDENTTNDMVDEDCVCVGSLIKACGNDEITGAIPITTGNIWGNPGWDTFDVSCATPSMPNCEGNSDINDSWYSFVAESENQGILARANPSNDNASAMDIAIQVFDSEFLPLTGETEGACQVDRSCFNNSGAGEIERAVPTGLKLGHIYYYRVYNVNENNSNALAVLDTKVKTYASHPIVSGCDTEINDIDHTWVIESPQNLYNIPPVPVFNVRMVISDLEGNVVSVSNEKNPILPGGLMFSFSDFDAISDGDYIIQAQNEVKMNANGCVSAFWSQLGPACEISVALGLGQSINIEDWSVIVSISLDVYPNPNDGSVVYVSLC